MLVRCSPVSGGLIPAENSSLLHFLPAFGAELGPGGDWFPAVGTGCHGLCRGGATNMVAPQLGQNRAPCWTPFPHLGHATSAAWGCIEGCICAFITWGMRTIPDPRPAPEDEPRLAPMSFAVSILSTSDVAALCLIQRSLSRN